MERAAKVESWHSVLARQEGGIVPGSVAVSGRDNWSPDKLPQRISVLGGASKGSGTLWTQGHQHVLNKGTHQNSPSSWAWTRTLGGGRVPPLL